MPVLPEAREAVKATLATIAAAAAHAHEHEHDAPRAGRRSPRPTRRRGAAALPRLDVFAEFAGSQPAGGARVGRPVEELELTAVPADVFEADSDEPDGRTEPADAEPADDADAQQD